MCMQLHRCLLPTDQQSSMGKLPLLCMGVPPAIKLMSHDSADSHWSAGQAKYGSLSPESRSVQRGEEPPTYNQLQQRMAEAKKLRVRDVWGLMLTTVPCRCPVSLFPL